jgi:hypothetical protein
VQQLFNSSYFNEAGFHLLQAQPDRLHRLTFDANYHSCYDVAGRVWRPDPDDDTQFLVLRAWIKKASLCRHLVLDAATALTVADELDSREGDSWKRARARLTATGLIT